jgi:hypothetical protein
MPPATAAEPSLSGTIGQDAPAAPVPAPGTVTPPAESRPGTAAAQRQTAGNTEPAVAPRSAPEPAARQPEPAARQAEPAPRVAERAPRNDDYVFLDEEPPAQDGREAGERLAGTYRQGGGGSGGTFGASGRFNARERSPRNLAPAERPAVATIRHLIDRMEAFHRKEGRYAGLADLRAAGLALDVPVSGNAFTRRGFRFEVTVESDGFRITATPQSPSGRSFVGDDSGFIRAGLD